MLEQNVLDLQSAVQTLPKDIFVEEVAHLDADFSVLVRVEGGDAAFGGAEGFAAQTLLLIGVLKDVIGHQQLGTLRDNQIGSGDALIGERLQFCGQLDRVYGYAVADDVDDMGIEDAGRERVEREPAVIIDDGVAGIGTALKADDNVRGFGQQVGDLALALVAPVGAHDRFYHMCYLHRVGIRNRCADLPFPAITQHLHYTASLFVSQEEKDAKSTEKH